MDLTFDNDLGFSLKGLINFICLNEFYHNREIANRISDLH